MKSMLRLCTFIRAEVLSSKSGILPSCANGCGTVSALNPRRLSVVLALIGCSSVSVTNYAPDAEPWLLDSSLGGASAEVGTSSHWATGGSSTVATGGSFVGFGGTGVAQSSSLPAITTGGVSTTDPGACPCPQNTQCAVLASGCNVPGTTGDAGNETFTCFESRLQCPTDARPVFCFSC